MRPFWAETIAPVPARAAVNVAVAGRKYGHAAWSEPARLRGVRDRTSCAKGSAQMVP